MNPYQPADEAETLPQYNRGDWFCFGMVAGCLLAMVVIGGCDELRRRGFDPVQALIDWLF